MHARGAQAQTGARTRRASDDRRARGAQARPRCARVRARSDGRAQISSPKVDLVSLFAIWRAYLRAHTRAHTRAYLRLACAPRARASICSRVSRARLSLIARLARARVKCSRARAAHPAAGEVPYMNSYVLNQANIYFYIQKHTRFYTQRYFYTQTLFYRKTESLQIMPEPATSNQSLHKESSSAAVPATRCSPAARAGVQQPDPFQISTKCHACLMI